MGRANLDTVILARMESRAGLKFEVSEARLFGTSSESLFYHNPHFQNVCFLSRALQALRRSISKPVSIQCAR